MPVDRLPGFADGDASVQDAAAQFAALLQRHEAGGTALVERMCGNGRKPAAANHVVDAGLGIARRTQHSGLCILTLIVHTPAPCGWWAAPKWATK